MGKRIGRAMSRGSRRVEVFCIVFVVCCLTVGTLAYIVWRRTRLANPTEPSRKCGSDYSAFSVDISGAEEDGNGGYPPGTFWEANGTIFGCPCLVKPCIRKCCPPYQHYIQTAEGAECIHSNTTSFETFKRTVYLKLNLSITVDDLEKKTVSGDHFYTFYGDVCGTNGKFPRYPEENPDDVNFLMEDGTIYSLGQPPFYLDQSQYCLESLGDDYSIRTWECFTENAEESTEEEDEWVFTVLAVGMLMSVPFLLATLLVYALLPRLRNLHGKTLMCHVSSLMVAYICLSGVQLFGDSIPDVPCVVSAYTMQFTLLASFFWLNVMCLDIWWVFSGIMPLRCSVKEAEHKKFLIYSVYAWGCPFIITSVTAIMDLAPWVPSTFIKPQFRVLRCWFKEDEALVVYFYLPIGVLVCMNLIMFTTTSCRLYAHTTNPEVLNNENSRRHANDDKKKFTLYLKLFLVMGVAWVMELVSFLIGGSKRIWLISDLCNTLQGLLIFLIFVCNRQILGSLSQKFCPSLHLFGPVKSFRYHDSRNNSTNLSRTNSTNIGSVYSTKLIRTNSTNISNVYSTKM